MCDKCGHDHDDLDKELERLFLKMSEGQKSAYLMMVGVLSIIRSMDIAGSGIVFRSELVDKVNSTAAEEGIEEAILALAKYYQVPL